MKKRKAFYRCKVCKKRKKALKESGYYKQERCPEHYDER